MTQTIKGNNCLYNRWPRAIPQRNRYQENETKKQTSLVSTIFERFRQNSCYRGGDKRSFIRIGRHPMIKFRQSSSVGSDIYLLFTLDGTFFHIYFNLKRQVVILRHFMKKNMLLLKKLKKMTSFKNVPFNIWSQAFLHTL